MHQEPDREVPHAAAGPGRRPTPPRLGALRRRGIPRGVQGRARTALALVLGLAAPACVCPAPAVEVAQAGFRTPEATLRSFQAYLASDLVDFEYRCWSRDFRRRNGISLGTYTEARATLFDRQPWLKYMAKAEIVRQWSEGEAVHGMELRILGRTVRVRLVREDSFEILAAAELLHDGYADFDRHVRVVESPRGPVLEARIPPGATDLERATSLVFERTWKIDELSEGAAGEPAP